MCPRTVHQQEKVEELEMVQSVTIARNPDTFQGSALKEEKEEKALIPEHATSATRPATLPVIAFQLVTDQAATTLGASVTNVASQVTWLKIAWMRKEIDATVARVLDILPGIAPPLRLVKTNATTAMKPAILPVIVPPRKPRTKDHL